jgi:hypothetical protein
MNLLKIVSTKSLRHFIVIVTFGHVIDESMSEPHLRMSGYRWDQKPPYATDCILSLGVIPSDGSPSPKRNGGLAIKTTPKKLHTIILSIATLGKYNGCIAYMPKVYFCKKASP